MDPPELTREGPDYIASWPGVMFRFSRLHDSRDDLVSLLNISLHGFPGRPDGELYEGKIVLTGSRSKSDAVKACKDRVGETDWYPLLEKACRTVRQSVEEGDPAIRLTPKPPSEAPGYLIPPLLREGDHTILYARGGTGKSLLGLASLLSLTTGVEHMGLPVLGEPGPGIYADWEEPTEDIHRERLAMLCAGCDHEPPPITYKHMGGPLYATADALARLIAREGVRYLVNDSVALACGADPEKADAATMYYRALLSTGIRSSLNLAHHAKHDTDGVFGSVFWENTMRSVWFAKAGDRDDDGTLNLALIHRKVNRGPLQKPFGLKVSFSPESISIRWQDASRLQEFREHLRQKDRVLASLRDGGGRMTRKDLQTDTSIPAHTLREVVRRLERAAMVAVKDDCVMLLMAE